MRPQRRLDALISRPSELMSLFRVPLFLRLDMVISSGVARKPSNPSKVGLPPSRQIRVSGYNERPAYWRTDVISVRYPSSSIVAMKEGQLPVYFATITLEFPLFIFRSDAIFVGVIDSERKGGQMCEHVFSRRAVCTDE
jgi:hypothetical protein